MLLRNMIYKKKIKSNKTVIRILQNVICISMSILMVFSSYATNANISEIMSNPSNSDAESINANKFIYRTYDENTKKKIDDDIIEYDDIEELIHNYNPNIMSMWNSYKNNKTSTEVYDDYMEAYYNLMASGDSADSDAVRARMYAQAYSMKLLADNNVNDSIVNFLQNELDEIKLYLSTKKNYINCFISNYNYLIAKENEQEIARVAENTKVKYQVGVETEISYLQAMKNADDAKANLVLAESNKNNAEKNVKVLCGKSAGTDVKIGAEPSIDVSLINSINLEEDIKKAIQNNINLTIYNKAFQNANTAEIENHYEILINYANEEITNNIKNLYNALQNQNTALNTRMMAAKLLNEELNKASLDLDNGKISASDYSTISHNLKVANYQVEIQKLNLLSAYEDYKYAVERGTASASLS